ncbi:separin isoform X1 [Diachasma alloeum]|uniref:separase n=2 Tax=Diachasma alloeum TaxID=454923 RepID=A0A4E0RK80_9HYME|nr:separin isoform X1 [Diachasma alloeum]THK33172.1 separase [Diachasma alloeum]
MYGRNFDKYERKYFPKNEKPGDLCERIKKIFTKTGLHSSVVEYGAFNKMMGFAAIAAGDEKKAVNHLIESHAVLHRQQVNLRYKKTEIRDNCGYTYKFGVNPSHLKFNIDCQEDSQSLESKLAELPREWYMVQLTQPYKPCKWLPEASNSVHPLHLTVLPTGPEAIAPFTITVPAPDNSMYDLCADVKNLLDTNKSNLQAEYGHHSMYWKMRQKQNNRMMTAVKEMEYNWLREWRLLLIADLLENSDDTREMIGIVDKLIADDRSLTPLSPKTVWLLRKVSTTAGYLSKTEIARLITVILPDNKKLASNLILSIVSKSKTATKLRQEKRKTTVLIVDEEIDYLPLEAMEILQDHPVTRFPSLHVAYAMFKEHEESIVEGCKVMVINEESGMGIVNPSNNLPKMEKRLRIFMDYWLPKWRTIYNALPEEEGLANAFVDALVNHEIMMYNGHGSGIQYLPGEKIEKLRVRAAVLLFGCGSVKLVPIGGRFPPYGVSNQYLTACSPCTLGMNWEVTDLDTDRMTSCFISTWIPSKAEKSWNYIDFEKWSNGTLEFKSNLERGKKEQFNDTTSPFFEPEMLRAVAISKKVCLQFMTKAAIVVRGLPVKVKWNE